VAGETVALEENLPVPLCPPLIPHGLTWDRNRATAMGDYNVTNESAPEILQPLRIPNIMPIFPCLRHAIESVQVWGPLCIPCNVFSHESSGKALLPLVQTQSWRITPFRLVHNSYFEVVSSNRNRRTCHTIVTMVSLDTATKQYGWWRKLTPQISKKF
jgi:hypothetical protein